MRLALFQPDIPQNLGAAVRLSACLGVALDVIEPCAFPLSDRSLKRAALDYTERRDALHASWAASCGSERREGRLVLFTTAGRTPLHDFVFSPATRCCSAARAPERRPEVHAAADARVVIPHASGARR
jgi:tRNA (cytidine/uridine-2'-O-)-methyltransferase